MGKPKVGRPEKYRRPAAYWQKAAAAFGDDAIRCLKEGNIERAVWYARFAWRTALIAETI